MWLITYWVVVLTVSFILSRRIYLTIDSKGISLHRAFGLDQHVTWDNCGCYKLINNGQETGIGIANRNYIESAPPGDYSKKAFALFINTDNILNGDEVEQAIREGFDFYVHNKSVSIRYEESNKARFCWRATCRILISILAVCYICFCYTYTDMMPDNLDLSMRYTLLNGGTYGDTTSSYSIGLYEIAGFIVYILLFLIPIFWSGGYYRTLIISLTATLLFIGYTAKLLIPERMMVYQNCSETIVHPIEKVNTVVSFNESGRAAHMSCFVNYEGKEYLIQSNYVEGGEINDSVLLYIQKGAKDIPIVRDIVIPQAHWSLLDDYQMTK